MGVKRIAHPVPLWPFLAVSAAWSQFSLAQFQQPQERNGGCEKSSLNSLSVREIQPTGSLFHHHLSTRPLVWPPGRHTVSIHTTGPMSYTKTLTHLRESDLQEYASATTGTQFFWFDLLLLWTRSSVGSRERVRNHFSVYFSGSARQPFITSKKQH